MNYLCRAKWARLTSLTLLAALVLYLTWHQFNQGQDAWFRWSVSVVPLLGFFPGLIKAQFRTGSWLCFLLLLYFSGFTLAAGMPGNTLGDALAIGLTVSLFISAMLFSRWQQRANLSQGVQPS